MKFKIKYKLKSYSEPHSRYYTALNPLTALEMFKETCTAGTLSGYNPQVLGVFSLRKGDSPREKHWVKEEVA